MDKRYRYITHGIWDRDCYPNAKIKVRWALFPTRVNGTWIWFKKYYICKILEHAFVLGGASGTISLYYRKIKGLSIFSFKSNLKEEGIIRNLYRQSIESKDNWNKLNNFILSKKNL